MNSIVKQENICTLCKIGTLKLDEAQFCVDRGDKVMLVEHVPALVCETCEHNEFDASIRDELTMKAHAIFAKSSCWMFAFQFNDLIRPQKITKPYEMFDHVRIKDDVDTWDMYDESLLPGMQGTVIERGEKPFDYVVDFRLGRGRGQDQILRVEIDENDLELVQRLGEHEPPKRKKTKVKM